MKKQIVFNTDARSAMLRGVEQLAKTVGSTLGPAGRNVIYENAEQGCRPVVTKDGVTVASWIELGDKYENVGAQMVKEVAARTCDDAGDGTTTATVLAYNIFKEGMVKVEGSHNAIEVQREITKVTNRLVDYIEANIREDVGDRAEEIAIVSSNWDKEIGGLVAGAIEEVGVEANVDVVESPDSESRLNVLRGVTFQRGYAFAHCVNNPQKQSCDMYDPYVLLVKGTINDPSSLVYGVLEQMHKDAKDKYLFIVADGYSDDVLQMLMINTRAGKVKTCAIKAPWYKDMREDTMDDLAVMLGTRCVDLGVNKRGLQELSLADLGHCTKIMVNGTSTTIVEGKGDPAAVAARSKIVRALAEDPSVDEVTRGNAAIRANQLLGCLVQIQVGAGSEVEYKEKADRIDDAVRATRAAIVEGIVPGACYSYIKGISAIAEQCNDAPVGYEILSRAVRNLYSTLLENAGLGERQYELTTIINQSELSEHKGFDLKTKQVCDLLAAGVVDPWLVTKSALINAASVAGLLLTCQAVVANADLVAVR